MEFVMKCTSVSFEDYNSGSNSLRAYQMHFHHIKPVHAIPEKETAIKKMDSIHE
jgi:hypothetical protein